MVEAAFAVNLVLAVAGVGACLWHAVPDRERVAFLATAIAYGLVLEQLVILHFAAYHYDAGDFLLTVGDVPVVIGLGWAAILYAGVEIGRRFRVSRRTLPLFVALFALHVDLAMDAVAIRVPFWTWTPPGPWFGVPLGNFTGWFLVASLFTAAWLATSARTGFLPAVGTLSIGAAVVGLVVLLEAWTAVATTLPRRVAILGGLVVGSVVVLARDGIRPAPVDPRLLAVPALFHGYYLALLVGLGMYREQPLLLVVSLSMVGVGAWFHWRGSTAAAPSATPGD